VSSDCQMERHEQVLGYVSELTFEVKSAALLHLHSKRRAELCSSQAVRFERSAALDKRQKQTSSGSNFMYIIVVR
jgi:hypothetical protein